MARSSGVGRQSMVLLTPESLCVTELVIFLVLTPSSFPGLYGLAIASSVELEEASLRKLVVIWILFFDCLD